MIDRDLEFEHCNAAWNVSTFVTVMVPAVFRRQTGIHACIGEQSSLVLLPSMLDASIYTILELLASRLGRSMGDRTRRCGCWFTVVVAPLIVVILLAATRGASAAARRAGVLDDDVMLASSPGTSRSHGAGVSMAAGEAAYLMAALHASGSGSRRDATTIDQLRKCAEATAGNGKKNLTILIAFFCSPIRPGMIT